MTGFFVTLKDFFSDSFWSLDNRTEGEGGEINLAIGNVTGEGVVCQQKRFVESSPILGIDFHSNTDDYLANMRVSHMNSNGDIFHTEVCEGGLFSD